MGAIRSEGPTEWAVRNLPTWFTVPCILFPALLWWIALGLLQRAWRAVVA